AMNIGLGLMITLSLLPVGILQTLASIDVGLWHARSADFLKTDLIQNLRWLRIIGDTVFLSGVAAFAWFVMGLWTGSSLKPVEKVPTTEAPRKAGDPDRTREPVGV
ncbi:MAG: nitric-oxide reductase large subunit, partial [Planctomycetes bacterium]|nr:nitric-oxide reductase large subunit [Planctomycetota bacterium]